MAGKKIASTRASLSLSERGILTTKTASNNHVGTCLGQCEAKTLLANVEFGVVLAHENVTEDPEWPTGSRNVNWHQTKEALRIICDCGLLIVELEVLSPKGKCKGELRGAWNNELFAK